MSVRQIVVVTSTRTTPLVLRSEAETWGQLKDSLSSEIRDLGSMRAVVKETKATLELDEAILPEGGFTLFLSAKQIKAGHSEVDVVSVLTRLKEEFVESVDSIIEDVQAGDYAKASNNYAVKSSYTSRDENADFLRKLQNL